MNRKEDTVFCYYAHNSVWTCELGYGADTMFHRTYFLFYDSSVKESKYGIMGMIMLQKVTHQRQDNTCSIKLLDKQKQ